MRSKILGGQVVEDVALWQAPTMESGPSKPAQAESGEEVADQAEVLRPLTAEQMEAMQESARQEGFRQGREEGVAAGEAEVRQQAQQWIALLDSLARPMETLDQQVVDELLALTLAVSRQIVRRELQTSPDEIVGVLREALAALPSQAANVRVALHPQDAALVRERLAEGEGEHVWRIVEDATLSRGGCRVQSDVSQVDATVEHRLNQLIAATLGDRRAGEGE